jgi:hypothetical protein
VRLAVSLVLAQALGLFALAVLLVIETVVGHPDRVGRALSGAAFALVGVAILGLAARGLRRLHPAARAPIVVLELLSLPVGYSLAFQAGRAAYGAPVLVLALAVLYLLFTPPARAVLNRYRDQDDG